MANKSKVALRVTNNVLHVMLNVVFYALVVFFIVRASVVGYNFSYQIFGDVSLEKAPGTEKVIEISQGESTMNVASKLERNQLIVDKNSFYLRAKLADETIMPGTYTINSSMNYEQIFEVISKPKKQ